jgi:hypothetical protein
MTKPDPIDSDPKTGITKSADAEPRKTDNTPTSPPPIEPNGEPPMSIKKPSAFNLEKFKSKRAVTMANVETLQTALPHYKIADAKDFVRLHPDDENYWSPELCFVNVPVKGQRHGTMHLIDEELAMRFLPSQRILRFRLALACKPHDVFFLCHVPTRNLENSYNDTNEQACTTAKEYWTQATSRREEGVDAYKIEFSRDRDAFPPPNWPKQSLADMIEAAFQRIDSEDHPGLLRLIGAKQSTS